MTKKSTALVPQSAAVVLPSDLGQIADAIRAEWGRGLDAQFAIGHLLGAAYAMLVPEGANNEAKASYTSWLQEQGFPFSQSMAWRLREAAAREQEVRAYLAEQTPVNGRDMGPTTAIQRLNARAVDIDFTPPLGEHEQRENTAYVALRTGIFKLLGWEVGEDGIGRATKNGLTQLAQDQLVELKTLVEALAAAYAAARRGS